MAIIKKKKAAGFKPREEFEAAVDRMAKLYVQVQKDEIGELYDNAEVYFKEHASDFCKPGTKQGETKLRVASARPTTVSLWTFRHVRFRTCCRSSTRTVASF